MTNCKFGFNNYLVTLGVGGTPGTVSDNGSLGGLTSSNLAGPTQYPPWDSSHPGACILQYDAGSAVPWDCVGLFGLNWTTAATIRIEIGTTAGGNDIYDSGTISAGIVPGYKQSVNILPSTQTGRYLKVAIADASNPSSYLVAGLAYLGPLWSPTRNFAYAQAAGWQDDSTVQTAKGGQKYFIQSPPYRKQTFKLENLTESELWAYAAEMDRLCTIQQNVLFVPTPGGTYQNQEAVFGTMKASDQQIRTTPGRYSKSYEIDERL